MPSESPTHSPSRRRWLVATGGVVAWLQVPSALAAPSELQAAIDAYTGGAQVRQGKVALEIAALVENGNVVPVTIAVDSPMTADDHVTRVALFNERNPERDVAREVGARIAIVGDPKDHASSEIISRLRR